MKKILTVFFCLSIGVICAYFFIFWQNKKEHAKIVSFLPEKITPAKSAFSLENAPTESLKATISTMSGEILWQSRTATRSETLLSKDLLIQQGERLIASESGSLTLNFDLAGELMLFPDSEIEIVQTLPVNLVFKQTQGVVDYESKANTFAVLVNRLLVSFSNAAANVSVNDINGVITVKVYRGQVTAAYNDQDFISQKIILSQNESFVFDNEKKQGKKNSF